MEFWLCSLNRNIDNISFYKSRGITTISNPNRIQCSFSNLAPVSPKLTSEEEKKEGSRKWTLANSLRASLWLSMERTMLYV